MKVVVYARNATRMHGKVGNSTRAQVATCHRYTQRKGRDLVGVFVDVGFPSSKLDRPALDKMRTLLARDSIKRVVVRDLSHLTRSIVDLLMLEKEFARRGTKLHCVMINAKASRAKFGRALRSIGMGES